VSAVIGYIRVSTATQMDQGDGLGVQRDRITAWCKYQGLELRALEEDAGLSGATTDQRPGFRAAVRAALGLGKHGVLVVYKLDRLGRSAIDVQEVLAVLIDADVRVVSIADGLDSSSGMGAALLKLLTSILATFAELERESIKTRLLDGRRRASAQDRVYASEPRYGRRVTDAKEGLLAPDAGEAAVMGRIQELRKQGLSYRAIAAVIDKEGFKPRRAASWNPVVVARIATGRRAPKKSAASQRIDRARRELLKEEE
jgi:site-specific DNA recombinase